MGGVLSVDESIDRAYKELDKRILQAYIELDKRALQYKRQFLSSGIAFGYFAALVAYGFYNPPQFGTLVAALYVSQLFIVGFWILILLNHEMTEHVYSQSQTFGVLNWEQVILLSLMTFFVLFVFTHSGVKGRDQAHRPAIKK